MALSPGTALGPYQIEAPLGAGGMGEVYKARDTRLDRTVAIKVLPEHVAADPDLKQRFEREAKTVAALSHPHICPVFDVGNQDGVDFLVMEYLDGQTLAQRLEKGALPLDQALQIAIQIADALDKAHRQGIVHRDLKPGNIMLTKSGAKLLDFGLAKLRKPGTVGAQAFEGATRSESLTGQGSILGTLQYMAPEQLEGRNADTRSDIFAFGAVVYEMVTGTKAFGGKSQASLIGAIMTADPPAMSSLQAISPPALDRIVKRCLAKDPDERWQSTTDLHAELDWIAQGDARAGTPVSDGASRTTRDRLSWVASGGAAAAVLAIGLMWFVRSDPLTLAADHLAVTLPRGVTVPNGGNPVAMSPDGRRVVFVGASDGQSRLYLREMNQPHPVPLPGTTGAQAPFFSPDGEWVAFAAAETLRKVSVTAAAPVTICELPAGAFPTSWGSDDRIWLGGLSTGLYEVSAIGGAPQPVTVPTESELGHVLPYPLPDGRGVVFTVLRGRNVSLSQVAVWTPGGGAHRVLAEGGQAQFSPTGHIVFRSSNGRGLSALPFDTDSLQATGPPVTVLDGVRVSNSGFPQYHLGNDGSLAYVPGESIDRSLVWVDRNGDEEPIAVEVRPYGNPRISPDGRRVAVEIDAGNRDIWIIDLAQNTSRQLTFDPADDHSPLWTPMGERIVFGSVRGGSGGVFVKAADGTGQAELLASAVGRVHPRSWSSDGQHLVVQTLERGRATGMDVATISMDSERTWHPLLTEVHDEGDPAISLNGRWMVFQAQGRIEVRPYPEVESGQWQLGCCEDPSWSRDGRELFYRSGTAMMAVPVVTEPSFTAGVAKPLFEDIYLYSPGRHYDVAQDGRFLMVRPEGQFVAGGRQVNIVRNWTEELKARVPSG